MLAPISSIDVDARIREDYGKPHEWEKFVDSFAKYGQLQPIKVESNGEGRYKLIAGDRRLRAISQLHEQGKTIPGLAVNYIEVSFRDPVPLHTKLMLEHAENTDRKDFDFIERSRFIRKFHELMTASHGDAWTQEMTAHSLNLSNASISHYLRIEEAVKTNPAVAKAATMKAAVKRMKVDEKIKSRKAEVAASSDTALATAASILHCGDARDWILGTGDETVDLVNFDPPWGDNISYKAAENHESFDDSTEYADELVRDLLPQLYRVLKPDRFLILWHSIRKTEQVADLARAVGFNVQFTGTPCIWHKIDKITDQNRVPEKQLIEAYEAFYILRKGDPVFYERHTNNVFSFARVKLGDIIHPTEKPVELNTALLKLCSVPGELVLDPTAGSSSFPDAAIRHSRRALACEKSERYHERGIVRLADYLKNVRIVEKKSGTP